MTAAVKSVWTDTEGKSYLCESVWEMSYAMRYSVATVSMNVEGTRTCTLYTYMYMRTCTCTCTK